MTHVKKFKRIPMSKSMRDLCKEEDYAFLGMTEGATRDDTKGQAALGEDWQDKKEERARRRLEREKQEKDKIRAIEESRKEKEQQWRNHIADVTQSQEKALQDRLTRLRKFREFQKKVLGEEVGLESQAVSQLLTRM